MIEKIVAEMPKAENFGCSCDDCKARWIISIQAQCQLLAEQGWRKVPSKDACEDILSDIVGLYVTSPSGAFSLDAKRARKQLHRWWLEGE